MAGLNGLCLLALFITAHCYFIEIKTQNATSLCASLGSDHKSLLVATNSDIIKLDLNGRTDWSKSSGSKGHSLFKFIVQSKRDKTTFIVGSQKEPMVIKLGAFGTKIWEHKYVGTTVDYFDYLVEDDAFLYLAGRTNSMSSVVKIDSQGTVLWEYPFAKLILSKIEIFHNQAVVVADRAIQQNGNGVVVSLINKDTGFMEQETGFSFRGFHSSTNFVIRGNDLYVIGCTEKYVSDGLFTFQQHQQIGMFVMKITSLEKNPIVVWASGYQPSMLSHFAFRPEQIAIDRDGYLLVAASSEHPQSSLIQHSWVMKLSQIDGEVKWAQSWNEYSTPTQVFPVDSNFLLVLKNLLTTSWFVIELSSDGKYSKCSPASFEDKTSGIIQMDFTRSVSTKAYSETSKEERFSFPLELKPNHLEQLNSGSSLEVFQPCVSTTQSDPHELASEIPSSIPSTSETSPSVWKFWKL